MYMLAANHDVEDYPKWKAVYDAIDQGALGARFGRVNRNVDNPNNLTIIHGFDTVDTAQAFINSPVLKEAMAEAGVASVPRFELFEELEVVEY